MKKLLKKSNEFALKQLIKTQAAMRNNRGEGYIGVCQHSCRTSPKICMC